MIYKWKRVELLESKKLKNMPVAYFSAFWCADTLVQAALCSLPSVRQKLTRFATPPFSFNLLRSVKRGALRARKTKQACGRQVVRIAKAIRVALPASTTSERTLLRSDFSMQKNQSHAPSFLLFREKSRLLRLCPCKRGHNASAVATNLLGALRLPDGISILFPLPKKSARHMTCSFVF